LDGRVDGRVALVTGVSRPAGIGFTLAERLTDLGATVFATGWPAHDDEMPWGSAELPMTVERRDLEDPEAPAALVDAVVEAHGAIDIVLAVHARSSSVGLGELNAEEMDRCWAANVRSIVLLAQRFAKVHDPERPGGRMLWFTSGQHRGPMPGELPYAISKGALHQMTASLAVPLRERGIVANCIDPGPVDTGWATPEQHAQIVWNTTDDVADLVEYLLSDGGSTQVGQVIDLEVGIHR
jgi:3-oxoacyl-[acyl-carrier protein] reductase